MAATGLMIAFWPVHAANPPPAGAQALDPLLRCSTIASGDERLACYDAQVRALRGAMDRRDVLVVDRETVRKSERARFGLGRAAPPLLDRGPADKAPEFAELVGKVTSVGATASGKLTFGVDGGSHWVQTDTRILSRDPRPGMPVRIRRGAVGSYFANLDGQLAIRVSRVR